MTDIPIPDNYYWKGERVRLRPMRPEDADVWLLSEYDTEAERFLNCGVPLPSSYTQASKFAERFADFKNKDQRIMFVIENERGDDIGGINIHSMNRKNGTFETGTRIYAQYRGQGYGLEAKLIVLRYAFHELRFQKYNIHCLSDNERMRAHAKKLGCQQEGRIRRHIYTNGRFYDELIFGLTREEFDEHHG